jgi:hypothetical protein
MATTKAGAEGKEKPKRKVRQLSITVGDDVAERFTVYARRRRKPLGVLIEPLIRRLVKGMVMPSMPDEIEAETENPEVPPEASGGIGAGGAVETAVTGEDRTSSEKPTLVALSGAEEGGKAPLPPIKLSTAQAAQVARAQSANRPKSRAG